MDAIQPFFLKIRTLFSDFQKYVRETQPANPPLVARLKVKESTRGQRGSELGLWTVYKWFPAKRKIATGLQMVKAIK